MFSGRWEDSVKRDEDGAVFFDVNPQYFGYILDYLRAKKSATPENPAPSPKVLQNQEKNFSNLVEYLGLSKEIVPTEIATEKLSEKFNLRSPEISIQEDGKVAVHDSRGGHKYVLGENVYQHGIIHFKLKLESFKDNYWIMVAILKADVVQQSDNSFFSPGCNGWYLGTGNPAVNKNGSYTSNNTFNVTKQGLATRFKLKLESFRKNKWIMVGILKADVVPQSDNIMPCSSPGCNGWSLGTGNPRVFKNGSFIMSNTFQNVTKQGDTVELVLDCDAGKLSLHLPTGQQSHIEIPKSQSWRLHVNLRRVNDKIRIVEVVKA
jgi:hypothetical protein